MLERISLPRKREPRVLTPHAGTYDMGSKEFDIVAVNPRIDDLSAISVFQRIIQKSKNKELPLVGERRQSEWVFLNMCLKALGALRHGGQLVTAYPGG